MHKGPSLLQGQQVPQPQGVSRLVFAFYSTMNVLCIDLIVRRPIAMMVSDRSKMALTTWKENSEKGARFLF